MAFSTGAQDDILLAATLAGAFSLVPLCAMIGKWDIPQKPIIKICNTFCRNWMQC